MSDRDELKREVLKWTNAAIIATNQRDGLSHETRWWAINLLTGLQDALLEEPDVETNRDVNQ